jgi:hypothetical protein
MPAPAKPLAWYEGEEVPRAGTTSAAALARRQRLYRAWVWASVVLAPLAFLTALISATRPAAQAPAPTSPGEAAAIVALRSWLAAKPPPLPGGRIVTWTGASRLSQRAKPGWSAEQDDFIVLAAGGQMWLASVEVALVPGASPIAIGTPSIEPLPPQATAPASGPWPGLGASTDVPPLVGAAIRGWARAYVSGDPAELRLAVGDNNPAHVYTPLQGVVAEATQIPWYAPLPRSADAVAQVQLWLRWAGERAMAAQPMTLDVLVARASGLAPLVVSWGPPGTGPTLKQYSPQ